MTDTRLHSVKSTVNRVRDLARAAFGLAACATTLFVAAPASAQNVERPPVFADDAVGILNVEPIDRLGEQVPLDLVFTDHDGVEVRLEEYFTGDRPVILTLNYFRCPMLCIQTLNGLVDGLRDIDWEIGRDFTMLTVSFDPSEGPELGAAKRENYLARYGSDPGSRGWDFLTGERSQIDALCDAVGFVYKYDLASGEYSHPASVIFIDPDGVLTKHVNDVLFRPADLRLAIVEASKGTVGTWVDDIVLFTCFQWDPAAGGYTLSIIKLMRAAGILFLLGLAIVIVVLARTRPGAGSKGGGPGDGVVPSPEKVVTS